MGNRIDDLEKSIGDLMTQAGVWECLTLPLLAASNYTTNND